MTEVPAPWNLKGRGYILLYNFKKEDLAGDPFLPENLRQNYCGGRGALMVVDYESSDAGPYQELLFIPGRVKYGEKKLYTISRIFVSTQASVVNGRRNWAIPKDQGDFTFTPESRHRESLTVTEGGQEPFFSARFSSGGFPFPVHTALLPFPLVQEQEVEGERKAFFTQFTGKGWGRLASVKDVKVNPSVFPILAETKPWLAIQVEPFQITFPVARIERAQT